MNKINNFAYQNYNVSTKGNYSNELPDTFNDNKAVANHTEYISSDISAASRAYGLSFINKNKIIPQMSLQNMVKWLESQDKVEGEDFEIDSSCTLGNTVVTIMNKQKQPEAMIHYDNGNHSAWSGYETMEYNNGKIHKSTSRDESGNITASTQIFDKKDIRIQHLLDKGVANYTIPPQKYLEYLENNNIDYTVEYFSEKECNDPRINIKLYDKNKNLTKFISYHYDTNDFSRQCRSVDQSDYNKDGGEYRRIMSNKDSVEITTYVNYL